MNDLVQNETARRSLLLGAAAFYVPLSMLGSHPGFLTRDYRLFAIGAAAMMVGWTLVRVLDHWFHPAKATDLAFVVMLVLAIGGRSAGPTTPWTITAVLVTVIVLVLVVRIQTSFASVAFLWLGVTLWLWALAGLTMAAIGSWSRGEPVTPVEATINPPDGDVVVAIFDEYPGATFAAESLGVDMSSLQGSLARSGFEVLGDIRANYAWTELALPSFFLLELPVAEGDSASEETRPEFLGAIGGDSPFVAAFKRAGFSVTLVESGWSGLRCMEMVDTCVVRSWFDEVTWSLARRSILNGMVASALGDPFALGVERTIDWMRSELPGLMSNGRDDLVILHLMVPHTPVIFDSDCTRVAGARVDVADQIGCANNLMLEMADTTGAAGVVLFVGDHGTKTLDQSSVVASEWTADMVDERMVTFAAIKGLAGCTETRPQSVTNLSIWIVRCLGADEPRYVPDISLGTSLQGEPLVELRPRLADSP